MLSKRSRCGNRITILFLSFSRMEPIPTQSPFSAKSILSRTSEIHQNISNWYKPPIDGAKAFTYKERQDCPERAVLTAVRNRVFLNGLTRMLATPNFSTID